MVEHQASRFVEHAIGLACLLGADRELDSSITSKRIVSHLLFHFNLSHNDKEMLQAPNCSNQRDDEDMKLSHPHTRHERQQATLVGEERRQRLGGAVEGERSQRIPSLIRLLPLPHQHHRRYRRGLHRISLEMLRPNVRAAINFEDVEPVSYKKTLAFINNFVINTTQFMNRFSYLCEEKLGQVSKDIQRIEITLAILEAKLASIPGLEQITTPLADDATIASTGPAPPPPPGESAGPVAPTASATPPTPTPAASSSSAADDDDFDSDSDDDGASGGPPAPAAVAAAPDAAPVMTMKDDPRYERYFKMLKMGVLMAQVKQKMQMEGYDPNILEYVCHKLLEILYRKSCSTHLCRLVFIAAAIPMRLPTRSWLPRPAAARRKSGTRTTTMTTVASRRRHEAATKHIRKQ